MTIYACVCTASDDSDIGPPDLDLHYKLPDSTLALLQGHPSHGGTLDLSDAAVQIDTSLLARFCQREAFLGVMLDVREQIAETNEKNNVALMTANVIGCEGKP